MIEDAKASLPGFSRSYARKRGLPNGVVEAAVVRFLSHHVASAIEAKRNRRSGKNWYFNSLKVFAEKLSYVPKATLEDILKRLERDKQIEIANFNKLELDRTHWYWVPKEVRDQAEEDVIYFNQRVANRHGLCAGVLYENLKHTSKSEPAYFWKMSPTMLARVLPFSQSTIRRTLKKLVKARVIAKDNTSPSLYHIVMPETHKVLRTGMIVPMSHIEK